MDRILVPLDRSTLAEAILPLAGALARAHKAELFLLEAVAAKAGRAESEEREARVYLARLSERLQDRGVSVVRVLVPHGKPDRAIAEAAAEHRVDLIAMTTHGRTGLSRLLVGSVAEAVVRHAPAPVLVVRSRPSRGGQIRQVLVPLDGSELSAAILPVVERLAGPLEFVIHLLHAIEPLPAAAAGMSARIEEIQAFREQEAEGYLDKVARTLEAEGLAVRRVVRVGPAVEAIQRYALEAAIDLIAMTTHGRTGLSRLLFGSVAEQVLRAVAIPLVLWKQREG